ncbi:hypothetical protein D3C78_1660810 [compost metagenome]
MLNHLVRLTAQEPNVPLGHPLQPSTLDAVADHHQGPAQAVEGFDDEIQALVSDQAAHHKVVIGRLAGRL